MNEERLTTIYRLSGIFGLLFLFGSFLVEMDFLRIRNDDELMIASLIIALISLVTSFFALFRKIYLYGSTLTEKIVIGFIVLLLIFSLFMLFFIFTFNINMI